MESIVIGTAGHIDHGKTALVKALTGHDTDTLEEEKRRGITINLGFAYFTLPGGKVAGIVDVPGHERFIKNMLAGASGIDIAMLVIAANEGVMPQTREHIDILSYMDIRESFIVLTKTDMVEDDFKALVLEDTREYLQTTFLAESPIFEVDSLSGKGIDAVISYIDTLSLRSGKRKKAGDARMSVDRAFSVKGFGTVVTGTLSDGTIRVDDELMIYPGELAAKVRTLQIHEQDMTEAHTGQRTAMNLAGITVKQVQRGSVVAKRDSVAVTQVMDVHLTLTRSTGIVVKRMTECKIYLGAKELVAKIIPLGVRQVTAGQEAYGQVLLEQPAVVRRGDTFVLRTLSPVETIGGGRVLDPNVSRFKKADAAALELVRRKHLGTGVEILESFIREYPYRTAYQLQKMINADTITADLKGLLSRRTVVRLDDIHVHSGLLDHARSEATELLKSYHEAFPLRAGMPKAEFASRQGFAPGDKELEAVLGWLAAGNVLRIEQGNVRLAEFAPTLSVWNRGIMSEIEDRINAAGYTLLTMQEIAEGSAEKDQVLESMLQTSHMLLQRQFVISREGYQRAIGFARELFSRYGAIRLADFRNRLETSRKYALLLLERFDKERLTKRVGEDRVLLQAIKTDEIREDAKCRCTM